MSLLSNTVSRSQKYICSHLAGVEPHWRLRSFNWYICYQEIAIRDKDLICANRYLWHKKYQYLLYLYQLSYISNILKCKMCVCVCMNVNMYLYEKHISCMIKAWFCRNSNFLLNFTFCEQDNGWEGQCIMSSAHIAL